MYRNKHGSLNAGARADRQLAHVATIFAGAQGMKFKDGGSPKFNDFTFTPIEKEQTEIDPMAAFNALKGISNG